MKLKFQLVSPQRVLLQSEVDSVSLPTTMGQITVLPGHAPLVAELSSGELNVRSGKEEHFIHVAGGFVEVKPNSEVVVLADAAEHHHEIDVKEAEAAKQRAQEALKEKTMSEGEYATAAVALQRATSRLHIARKHAHRRQHPITSEGVMKQ